MSLHSTELAPHQPLV